jgi:DNA repair protein RadC
MNTLYVKDKSGQYHVATSKIICDVARIEVDKHIPKKYRMDSPQTTILYLTMKMAGVEREVFGVLFLTSTNEIIDYVEMFSGTINQAAVYPREIIKEALKLNASAIILVHNHPSGNVSPSAADIELTNTITTVCEMVEIRVLDHIIIANNNYTSFTKAGIMPS